MDTHATELGINVEGGIIYTPKALQNIAKVHTPKGLKLVQWHVFMSNAPGGSYLCVHTQDERGFVRQNNIAI